MSEITYFKCDHCDKSLEDQKVWVRDKARDKDYCPSCIFYNKHLLEVLTLLVDPSTQELNMVLHAQGEVEVMPLSRLRNNYPDHYKEFFSRTSTRVPNREELNQKLDNLTKLTFVNMNYLGKECTLFVGGDYQPKLGPGDFWMDRGTMVQLLREFGIYG